MGNLVIINQFLWDISILDTRKTTGRILIPNRIAIYWLLCNYGNDIFFKLLV